MRMRATACGLVVLLAVPLLAQAPARLTFEVASIKLNTSQATSGGSNLSPGRFVGKNVTARRIIGVAFQPLLDNQIVGGPDWLNTDRFEIEAKAAGNASSAQVRLMMQSLLAERFKLVTHRETRDLPVYHLVMARTDRQIGERLRPSQANCSTPSTRPQAPASQPPCDFTFMDTALRGTGATMEALARELSFVGRVVVDETNLAGRFDLDLEWADPDVPSDAGPSIFAAIQEQLGLRLESARGPLEVLVIDHIERPTED